MRDIVSLRIFVKIVERGSFAAAGDALNLSPSSVSKQFRALEDDLKAKLLHRSTHGVSLTEAGRIFFARCKSILAEIEGAREALAEIRSEIAGRLKIHVTPTVGQQIVVPLLSEFLREHPKLSTEIIMRPQRFDLIDSGIDLSIRTGGEDDKDLGYSSIESQRLGWARYVVGATPAYLAKHGRPADPSALAEHNCLVYTSQPSASEWWFRDGERSYPVAVSGQMVADDWSAIREAALSGLGIARFLANEIGSLNDAERRIETLFEESPVARRGIFAFYPRSPHPPRKIAALLKFLSSRLPE